MWTHTRMSFSSHTFTSLPLVHTPNPNFLGRQLWLFFSLVREFPRSRLPNQTSDRFPNFPSPEVRDFAGSRFQTFACSRLQGFADSRFPKIACSRPRGFTGPRFLKIACPRLQGFTGSRFLKIANALPLKTYLKNFVKLDVSRVAGFPEFPNTSPSGKQVYSDDPIPRTFWKFSKKCHPRNVGGDTRHPETSQRSNRGRFRGTTLLRPYK
jgi:hypothetical protein